MKNLILVFILFSLFYSSCSGQEYKYVSIERLNIRSSPELSESNVIQTLQLNDAIEVLELSGNWTKVKFNGIEGYVSSKYIADEKVESKNNVASGNSVLICNGSAAYAYHSRRCSGFNRCTGSESTIKASEAIALGRTPCKICYGASESSSKSNSSYSPTYKSTSSGSDCSSVQCSGITQKGLRCKNRTTNCNGRCYHH